MGRVSCAAGVRMGLARSLEGRKSGRISQAGEEGEAS